MKRHRRCCPRPVDARGRERRVHAVVQRADWAPPRARSSPSRSATRSTPASSTWNCRYCHYGAGKSPRANIPPISTCMGCHKIAVTDRPKIQKLTGYWDRGEQIPWVKVHYLPDYVKFNHKRHVLAGFACQQCHGPVQDMDVRLPVQLAQDGLVRDLPSQESQRPELPGDDGLPGLSPLEERACRIRGLQSSRLPEAGRRRRGRRRGRLRQAAGREADPVPGRARGHPAGRAVLLREHLPRVPGRLRHWWPRRARAARSSSRAIPRTRWARAACARAARRGCRACTIPIACATPLVRDGAACKAVDVGRGARHGRGAKLAAAKGKDRCS